MIYFIILGFLGLAPYQDVSAYPSPQFRETECLVPTSQTDEGAYEVTVENTGDEWDIINIFTENGHAPAFTTEVSDEYGDPLPDADGDGNPDTDTLPRGAERVVLVDVIPSDTVPVGTVDTCYFAAVSSRDTTMLDTAFLITTIIPSSVSEKPAALLPDFNFAFGQNVLYVSNPLEEELRLDFFDALGRRVYTEIINNTSAEINLSYLSRGVYFISFRMGDEERITGKVVVCK